MDELCRKQITEFLTRSGLFTAPDLDSFLERGKPCSLKKGEFMVEENEICNEVFFIHSGVFTFLYLKEGVEYVKDFSVSGKFITAYTSFMTQAPSRLYIRAEQDATLTKWNYDFMMHLLKTEIKWKDLFLQMANYLFIRKENREIGLLLYSAEQRYISFTKEFPLVCDLIPQHSMEAFTFAASISISYIDYI